MEQIIWSEDAMLDIATALKQSSEDLAQYIGVLRHCRAETKSALRDRDERLLQDVYDRIDTSIAQLEQASSLSGSLSRAVGMVNEMFQSAELEITKSFEDIEASQEAPLDKGYSGQWAATDWPQGARITVSPTFFQRTNVTPDWLVQAADNFFSSTY